MLGYGSNLPTSVEPYFPVFNSGQGVTGVTHRRSGERWDWRVSMSSLDLSPSDLSETDSWGWGEPLEHSRHQVDQMRRQSRSRSRDRDTNYRHQNRDIASKSNSNKFSQSGFLHHRPHPSITRWTNVIIIQYLILSDCWLFIKQIIHLIFFCYSSFIFCPV